MSLDTLRFALGGYLFAGGERRGSVLGTVLAVAVVAYICWKITESPGQAVQFAFNGLSVGAVYALLAMGFTLVYSTVWFFDLYYGAAAALGEYGVFYLRSQEALGGLYEVNNPYINILFAVVTAGVLAWALHVSLFSRLSARFRPRAVLVTGGAAGRRRRGVHGARLGLSERAQRCAQSGGRHFRRGSRWLGGVSRRSEGVREC